jgi:transposase
MFVRITNSGPKGNYHYLQLAESFRDPQTGKVKTSLIHNFGSVDKVDFKGIERLIESLKSVLPDSLLIQPSGPFEFLGSRDIGATWLLNGLWKRLGIDTALESLIENRQFRTPIERMMFTMVANRAIAPGSKLSIERWVEKQVLIPGLESVDVHRLYAAMDILIAANEPIQHTVFTEMAKAMDCALDILFLDTTSTYFEVEDEDEGDDGLRKRGHSKDNHPELAQVVIAFAVTREGIPVRCWVWPGNTSDQAIVQEVKHDLGQWNLGRAIMVEDTGFNSEHNRSVLRQSAGDFIIGEKLRIGSKGAAVESLHRAGRYKTLIREGRELKCKDVMIDEGTATQRRYVVVLNPDAAIRDAAKRTDIVDEAKKQLESLKQLEGEPHKKAACALRSHSACGRYIGQKKDGTLFIDDTKIDAEALLDGKFLISTSLMNAPIEDIVYGYKQLFEIERVFRDLKHVVDIRPVYHHLKDRIRAHVLICWIAMVLVRVAERSVNMTWRDIMHAVADIRVGINRTQAGELWNTSPLTDSQKALYANLKITVPPQVWAYKVEKTP